MLGRRILFLMLFHFFHLTLSAPSPDDPTRPRPAGSTGCYEPSDQTAMIPDVMTCIDEARGLGDIAYSDTGCRPITTSGTAEIGVCGVFHMSGEDLYWRMIQIEFDCWHQDFKGPTGGTWRDDGEPDWYLYIDGS